MEEEDTPVIFCTWIKHRRKALDLTQDELAERASCSLGTVRKIESGERRPSKQLAELLAKALEIPEQDQETFLRVARGALNIERLPQPGLIFVPPISELEAIQKAQASGLPTTSSQPTPAANRIPLQTTPLIGREAELVALERLFLDPQCRLLTLTGIGGIGKTRLALEFATRKASLFPGGVYYVPLAPVQSSKKVVPAIADVLGIGFSGPTDPKEQLFHTMARNVKGEALFIFDNLEQLLVPIPPEEDTGLVGLVQEFLRRLSHINILATSRERLNIHGEWAYEVHGLSVPPTDFVGRLDDYASIQLFMKSAQRTKRDFQVTTDEQAGLIQICQLVRGVPLAIEMAAAWVWLLSCQEIAQEIQSNLDFLTTAMRDVPERHRSIRATFDHSWKLLSEGERRALCQLSVFHGGFDRKAAYHIAEASLPILASLSTKSLVRRNENGRYDLHELIRQYALTHHNEQPCAVETHERHCDYYLKFLQDCESSLKSSVQQEVLRNLTDEIENILTAWAWAIQEKKFAQIQNAGRAFGWYFEIAGLYREGIEQLEVVVKALKGKSQQKQWGDLLGLCFNHQALLNFRKGELARAMDLYEESIETLRRAGNSRILADSLIFLGIILHSNGDYERAVPVLEEGLVLARANEELWLEAMAIYNLGHIAGTLGSYVEGHEKMAKAIATWRMLGDPHAIALGLNFLVPTLNKLGRYEEAISLMQESISLCERAKNRWGMGTAYRFLGLATIAAGQYTEAQRHLRKSLEIFGDHFVGWDIARTLGYLGDALLMSGDQEGAHKMYLDALRLATKEKALPIALNALLGVGNLQASSGKVEYAIALCYFILGHPSSEEDTKYRADRLRESLEPELPSLNIEEARAVAQGKTIDILAIELLGEA